MTAIRCRNLVMTYPGRPPVAAVRGIDLEIPQGECFGVLGPNGAGKTTTMEILEGLLEPTAGDVEILGMYWAIHPEKIREKIGISLQETILRQTHRARDHRVVSLLLPVRHERKRCDRPSLTWGKAEHLGQEPRGRTKTTAVTCYRTCGCTASGGSG